MCMCAYTSILHPAVQGLFVHVLSAVHAGMRKVVIDTHTRACSIHLHAYVLWLSQGFEICPAVRINNDWSIQHGAHTCSHTRTKLNDE